MSALQPVVGPRYRCNDDVERAQWPRWTGLAGYSAALVLLFSITYFEPVDAFTERHFQLMFSVQVEAPFHLAQLVLADMRAAGFPMTGPAGLSPEIMSKYYQPQRYFWDTNAQSAYLSIDKWGSTNDKFISYDDPTTCSAKVEHTKSARWRGPV
jgi:NAD(P)-dependent dehydrogenase (short-subunit alcohol dehydrogenase family)